MRVTHAESPAPPGGRSMSNDIHWILAGFLRLIVEMTTGTFYLLVLGLAAFAAAPGWPDCKNFASGLNLHASTASNPA